MTLSRPAMSAIRFGYGIRPGETVPDGPDALLAQVEAGVAERPRFPAEGIEGRWQAVAENNARQRDLPKDREKRRQAVRPLRRAAFETGGLDQHARVAQSAFSPYGFYERLAAFWSDHFSVNTRKRRPMYLLTGLYEAEVIRPLLAGPFADLLREAATHPAMLIYLDQIRSFGPNSRRASRTKRGLNENLGRELLELHTLGVGSGYSQDDVRATALVLTGLGIDRDSGRTDFRRNASEPGPIEIGVLGKSYGNERRSVDDVYAMLADLAAMPVTAQHICRKLAIHFIADEPPKPIIDAMVGAWNESQGNLIDVYAAMLRHPASWDDPGRKARQPYDYVVTGLRAAGIAEKDFAQPQSPDGAGDDEMMAITPEMAERRKRKAQNTMTAEDETEMREDKRMRRRIRPPVNPLTVGAIRKLGQPVWEPAGPAGTEEEFDAWVTSSQLTGRIEWAQRVSTRIGNRVEPVELAKAVLRDAVRDDTIKVLGQAPSRQAGLSLLLASPEFNRR